MPGLLLRHPRNRQNVRVLTTWTALALPPSHYAHSLPPPPWQMSTGAVGANGPHACPNDVLCAIPEIVFRDMSGEPKGDGLESVRMRLVLAVRYIATPGGDLAIAKRDWMQQLGTLSSRVHYFPHVVRKRDARTQQSLEQRQDETAARVAAALPLTVRGPRFRRDLPFLDDAFCCRRMDSVPRTQHGDRARSDLFSGVDRSACFLQSQDYPMTPTAVMKARVEWERAIQQHPVLFRTGCLEAQLVAGAAAVARVLSCSADAVQLLGSSVLAMATVLRSQPWVAGDTILVVQFEDVPLSTDVAAALSSLPSLFGVVCHCVSLSVSQSSSGTIAALRRFIEEQLGSVPPRLVVAEHVNRFGIELPRHVLGALRALRLPLLLEGTLAAGNIDVNLSVLAPQFYVAALDRFLFAPRGVSCIVSESPLAPITSTVVPSAARFAGWRFQTCVTSSSSCAALAALPTALTFVPCAFGSIQESAIRCTQLAVAAHETLTKAWGTASPPPTNRIAAVPLPSGFQSEEGAGVVAAQLAARRCYCSVLRAAGQVSVVLCCGVFCDIADVHAIIEGVSAIADTEDLMNAAPCSLLPFISRSTTKKEAGSAIPQAGTTRQGSVNSLRDELSRLVSIASEYPPPQSAGARVVVSSPRGCAPRASDEPLPSTADPHGMVLLGLLERRPREQRHDPALCPVFDASAPNAFPKHTLDPSATALPTRSAIVTSACYQTVLAYFLKYRPESVDVVPDLMTQFRGREALLLHALEAKYGAPPADPVVILGAPGSTIPSAAVPGTVTRSFYEARRQSATSRDDVLPLEDMLAALNSVESVCQRVINAKRSRV